MEDRKVFTIRSTDGKAEAQISTFGAALISLKLPPTAKETNNGPIDVVLGYHDLNAYSVNEPSLGVVVGRVAGRISNGTFAIQDETFDVTKNLQDKHCLHGGKRGLYHVNWDPVYVDKNRLELSYTSPHGEDGFPGSMHVQLNYKLDQLADREIYELSLHYKATMKEHSGLINITNHSYFNLAGHDQGKSSLLRHKIQIMGSKSLELDKTSLLPTGKVFETQGFKRLLEETCLEKGIAQGGYDLFYILDQGKKITHEFPEVIPECQFSALDPISGRKMVGRTDQPGVQFYTADCIAAHQPNGKHGKPYETFGAFCFETQAHPDAINLPTNPDHKWPNIVYYPNGEAYTHSTHFYFYDSQK